MSQQNLRYSNAPLTFNTSTWNSAYQKVYINFNDVKSLMVRTKCVRRLCFSTVYPSPSSPPSLCAQRGGKTVVLTFPWGSHRPWEAASACRHVKSAGSWVLLSCGREVVQVASCQPNWHETSISPFIILLRSALKATICHGKALSPLQHVNRLRTKKSTTKGTRHLPLFSFAEALFFVGFFYSPFNPIVNYRYCVI